MLFAPRLALGQDSGACPGADASVEASQAAEVDKTAALEEQVANQKDEIFALRADLERRLNEETAARKAARPMPRP